MYKSQVTYTLDMTCTWSYLAKKRLDQALAQVSPSASFTYRFDPFQPSPDFPETVEDRCQYSLQHKHNGNPEAQKVFQARMGSIAEPLGVPLNFQGPTGNTFHSHRVIQLVQGSHGADVTNKLVDTLFRLFFGEGRHPAADDTLIMACVEAGVPEDEAKALVSDREKGERGTKQRIRTVGMDVDAVPAALVEGRRRDLTLMGMKEVAEYVKALETIIKEST